MSRLITLKSALALFLSMTFLSAFYPAESVAEQSPCNNETGIKAFSTDVTNLSSLTVSQLDPELLITPGPADGVSVYLLGFGDTSEVAVEQRGTELVITGRGSISPGISIRYHGEAGNSIRAQIGNQQVAIPSTPPRQVLVCLSKATPFSLRAENVRMLRSSAAIRDASIKLSGNNRAIVTNFTRGKLEVELSSVSSAAIEGFFSEIEASTNNASRLVTRGVVKADYRATARGASSITHIGSTKGDVVKRSFQAGRIKIAGTKEQ